MMIKVHEKLRILWGTDFLSRLRKLLIVYGIFFFFLWFLIFLFFPKIFPILFYSYYSLVGRKPLVFISLEEALLVAIRASFYLTLMLILPFFLLKLWGLISEELYEYERRFLKRLFLLSLFLSLIGFIFGYFFLFPTIAKIFLFFGKNFTNTLTINGVLFFFLKVLLFSILAFQIPLILALLVKERLITEEILRQRRIYLLGIFFSLSFLISPGDFFSQILLTLIFYLFLRLSLLLSKLL